MKKRCNVGHLYSYTESRCPECFKQRDVGRESAYDRGYDNKWRKWRAELNKEFMYSFCWKCFLDKGRFQYKIHYHHILSIESYPELKYEVGNVVPLCGACHNETEAQIRSSGVQPKWKQVKSDVKEKLGDLTKAKDI